MPSSVCVQFLGSVVTYLSSDVNHCTNWNRVTRANNIRCFLYGYVCLPLLCTINDSIGCIEFFTSISLQSALFFIGLIWLYSNKSDIISILMCLVVILLLEIQCWITIVVYVCAAICIVYFCCCRLNTKKRLCA